MSLICKAVKAYGFGQRCHNNYKKPVNILLMNKPQHPRKLSLTVEQKPLPFLEQTKPGTQISAGQRKGKLRRPKQKRQLSEECNRIARQYDDIYSYIQDIYKVHDRKRKIIVAPTRGVSAEYFMDDCEPLKKELEKIRARIGTRHQDADQWSPFSSAIRDIPPHKDQLPRYKPMSQSTKSPKKGVRERLKPISQTVLKKQAQAFLFIERMNISGSQPRPAKKNSSTIDAGNQRNYRTEKCNLNLTADRKKQTIKIGRQLYSTVQNNTNYRLQKEQEQETKDVLFIEEGLTSNPKDLQNPQDTNDVQFRHIHHHRSPKITYLQTIKVIASSEERGQTMKKPQPLRDDQPELLKIKYSDFAKEKNRELTLKQHSRDKMKQTVMGFASRKKKQFTPPFNTYHYRDLLWKVNITNRMTVETPIEYEHRLKVYVGKGNNSALVRGLIKRRIWFGFTDRIEQANFVWTQLKSLPYLKGQPKKELPREPNANDSYQGSGVLTVKDAATFKKYVDVYLASEERCDERLLPRNKFYRPETLIKSCSIKQTKMHNHLMNNYVLGNKKALFHTMLAYYNETNQQIFNFVPITFHVKDGTEDENYLKFLKLFYKRAKEVKTNPSKKSKHNAWIVKPGQNSNRGRGIQVCLNLEQIKAIVKKRERYSDGSPKTFIIQSYIEHPLLYKKRKFDIRHFLMISSINGFIKGYWYQEGYVRTTSCEYSLKNSASKVHLTNDAVQKLLPDYGKYEKGNKISYDELQAYLEKQHNVSFRDELYPKMKQISIDAVKACSGSIDPDKRTNNFEIFGLDFMIDSDFNVMLIEVNSNPCYETSCPLLVGIIPRMLENALEITMDANFPPPVRYSPKGMHYFKNLEAENRFELVYDERIELVYKSSMTVLDAKLLEEEDDVFEDDGDQWDQDD